MERIQGAYLHVCFKEPNVSIIDVNSRLETFPDRYIYKSDDYIYAFLYKKNRFNITREGQIRSMFKIGTMLPIVVSKSKREIQELQNSTLNDIRIKNTDIIAKGIFKEKFDEMVSERIHNELKLENERLKQELREKTHGNITNIMIPNIYVNVKMNSLGEEDISQHTLEKIRKALENSEEAKDFFGKLVDMVHFDENCPENHNIHITKVDDKIERTICTTFKEDRWQFLETIHRLMYDLKKTKHELIEKIVREYETELSDDEIHKLKRFNKLLQNYPTFYNPYILEREAVDAIYTGTKTKLSKFRENMEVLR